MAIRALEEKADNLDISGEQTTTTVEKEEKDEAKEKNEREKISTNISFYYLPTPSLSPSLFLFPSLVFIDAPQILAMDPAARKTQLLSLLNHSAEHYPLFHFISLFFVSFFHPFFIFFFDIPKVHVSKHHSWKRYLSVFAPTPRAKIQQQSQHPPLSSASIQVCYLRYILLSC